MELTFDGEVVHGGNDARERFYDSRGYGRPQNGQVEFAPVEVAHLLFRGDIDAVGDARAADAQPLDFETFLSSAAVSEVDFFVYNELRERGFYLSPDEDGEFVVYPRGHGPWDGRVAYRVVTLSERAAVEASALTKLAHSPDEESTGVLAVVDEESEVTYFGVEEPPLAGSTDHELSPVAGRLLSDRVFVPNPPEALHERSFYGQRLARDGGSVQLSLVEAAYLARRNLLALEADAESERGILTRGRQVEGERFDRRLRVYSALRAAGIVPKTGFKFGADFRTYAQVDSVDELGHSEFLVRVLPREHTFDPRDLALDVRLAHGVRKQMLFALADGDGIDWLSVGRLTP